MVKLIGGSLARLDKYDFKIEDWKVKTEVNGGFVVLKEGCGFAEFENQKKFMEFINDYHKDNPVLTKQFTEILEQIKTDNDVQWFTSDQNAVWFGFRKGTHKENIIRFSKGTKKLIIPDLFSCDIGHDKGKNQLLFRLLPVGQGEFDINFRKDNAMIHANNVYNWAKKRGLFRTGLERFSGYIDKKQNVLIYDLEPESDDFDESE